MIETSSPGGMRLPFPKPSVNGCIDGTHVHDVGSDASDGAASICMRCGRFVCTICGRFEVENVVSFCEECGRAEAASVSYAWAEDAKDEPAWVDDARDEFEAARSELAEAGKKYGWAKARLARAEEELDKAERSREELDRAARIESELDAAAELAASLDADPPEWTVPQRVPKERPR